MTGFHIIVSVLAASPIKDGGTSSVAYDDMEIRLKTRQKHLEEICMLLFYISHINFSLLQTGMPEHGGRREGSASLLSKSRDKVGKSALLILSTNVIFPIFCLHLFFFHAGPLSIVRS